MELTINMEANVRICAYIFYGYSYSYVRACLKIKSGLPTNLFALKWKTSTMVMLHGNKNYHMILGVPNFKIQRNG